MSLSRPPEEQPSVKPFDPLVLDRTVIAIPLLEQMKEDLDAIREITQRYPDAPREFNAAIQYNPSFPQGLPAARQRTTEMARQAADDALRIFARRRDRAAGDARVIADRRLAALAEAAQAQVIGPPLPDLPVSFARLHAAVIRRLLAANEREPGPRLIVRIHPNRFEVIIDLNLEHPDGRAVARAWVLKNIDEAKQMSGVRDAGQEVHSEKDDAGSQYIFARLEARVIQELVHLDEVAAKERASNMQAPRPVEPSRCRAIFHIWPDFQVSAYINRSIATVKADAAQKSFSAQGNDITWAVMDSGINDKHAHFSAYHNIDPSSPLHEDFTVDGGDPFDDKNGHGTHVAGIIAGEWRVAPGTPPNQWPLAVSRYRKKEADDIEYQETRLDAISGMAPRCQLVSLRVLDENGKGSVSNLIAAINHIQEKNGYGRRLLIHGVNMSLGYNFEPEWFACGQSPLCVEVDRLVKSGVVVVVAAGNTGYGSLKSSIGASSAGLALTINDPGNADLAITVGSTHRDMPHVYGVSYFSSKGPTGDGRLKPDLVAPGEKIISAATGALMQEGSKNPCDYVETSGTSMAAPHVSGVIAAFLSVRREFIGQPERVKEIFVSTATDLRRERSFQGSGLVDLMRAIQSV
jgi:serine protease AprX